MHTYTHFSCAVCGGWNDSGNGFSWLQNIDVSGASSFAWLDGEQGWELGFMPLVGKFQADAWVSSQECMFWECQWLLSSLFKKPAWYSRQCLFAQSYSFCYSGCCFMAAGSRHESVGLNPVFMAPQKVHSLALSQLTNRATMYCMVASQTRNSDVYYMASSFVETCHPHMLFEHLIQHQLFPILKPGSRPLPTVLLCTKQSPWRHGLPRLVWQNSNGVHTALTPTLLNMFVNWNTDCSPDLLTRHQCLISIMLVWLNKQILTAILWKAFPEKWWLL